MGSRPIRSWQLQMLATELQYRGDDATGICLMDEDGSIRIHKNNEPAWKFCAQESFEKFCEKYLSAKTRIALVHTRKWTTGTPYHNENNHPISKGDGVIVHNGMVSNHETLFKANDAKLAKSCDTDSDIFRAIVDHHGGIDVDLIDAMSVVEGTAAVAALHPATPDKLLLLRDTNPLILGATADMLIFASDKTAIYKALKPWVKVHNFVMQVHAPDISFLPMPNETGYIIGPKGLEQHREFKCNGLRRQGNLKYTLNTAYQERRKRAELAAGGKKTPEAAHSNGEASIDHKVGAAEFDDMPDWVICPKISCSRHLALTTTDKQLENLAKLECGICGTNLAEALITVAVH